MDFLTSILSNKRMTLFNQITKGAFHFAVLSMVTLASILLAPPVLAQSDKTNKENKTQAEKLNFPKGKKVLLLHMDDIGMCPEANAAAIRYIENKNIMSAAVMMPCPNAVEFIEWAKTHPEAEIGLHLTLTSEWQTYRWPPVTDAAKVPGLIDPDGKLWHEVPDVVVHASAQEVETEIRAQIEKCLALGYRPTHIDTHMGTLYGSVEYTKAFYKIAEEYNIPANATSMSDPDVVSRFRRMGFPFDEEMMSVSAKYRLPKLDNFTSVETGATYEQKRDKFLTMIKSLKPGLTEIIFHPSVQTDNLKSITGSWQQRVWEAELFSDPIVTAFFQKEGIIITNWKEIMKRFETKIKK
ncbi:polysaccharide deacetylase family protein [Chryseolinea sp. T2]|uniref:polysaccharide deacetylase family protein n=1 Tax=Chryseolinea sp. T2 TaxID=3129255 RepID=UPI0030779B06